MLSTENTSAVLLFRDDLRLSDHQALSAAVAAGHRLTCVYIFDETAPYRAGGARRWWLHFALQSLRDQIRALGGQLVLRAGYTQEILEKLISETGACGVYWSRRYTPEEVTADTALKAEMEAQGCKVHSHAGRYLFEPWDIVTKAGTPFRVFTPFWRAALMKQRNETLGQPLPVPKNILFASPVHSECLEDFDLLPSTPNWAEGFSSLWSPGAVGGMGAWTHS